MRPEFNQFMTDMTAFGIEAGLPPSTARILAYLTICEPANQTVIEIKKHVRLSSGSISEALSMLRRSELITRTKQKGNREFFYELSTKGWEKSTIHKFDLLHKGIILANNGLSVAPANKRLASMRHLYTVFDETFDDFVERLRTDYTNNMTDKKTTEEFTVNGEELLAKVKSLINEGNIRRIIIKDESGKILVEFPLTIGVVGALISPILAAVGAIAALVTKCTIVVERREN